MVEEFEMLMSRQKVNPAAPEGARKLPVGAFGDEYR
jgi:hypothetical protein